MALLMLPLAPTTTIFFFSSISLPAIRYINSYRYTASLLFILGLPGLLGRVVAFVDFVR